MPTAPEGFQHYKEIDVAAYVADTGRMNLPNDKELIAREIAAMIGRAQQDVVCDWDAPPKTIVVFLRSAPLTSFGVQASPGLQVDIPPAGVAPKPEVNVWPPPAGDATNKIG